MTSDGRRIRERADRARETGEIRNGPSGCDAVSGSEGTIGKRLSRGADSCESALAGKEKEREKAAAEKAAARKYQLSERELEIVRSLGQK